MGYGLWVTVMRYDGMMEWDMKISAAGQHKLCFFLALSGVSFLGLAALHGVF